MYRHPIKAFKIFETVDQCLQSDNVARDCNLGVGGRIGWGPSCPCHCQQKASDCRGALRAARAVIVKLHFYMIGSF